MDLIGFTDEHVRPAAELLVEKHRRSRSRHPLLGHLDAAGASAYLEEALSKGASGSVALSEGEVVGYVLGNCSEDKHWGKNAWIPFGGHALGRDASPEMLRDLYAGAAGAWRDAGHLLHYCLVEADAPEIIDAWFRLGFGMQQVHGLMATDGRRPPEDPGFTIRRAGPEDLALVEPHVGLIAEVHERSPVFARRWEGYADEQIVGHIDLLADRDTGYFVAEDEQLLGIAVVTPIRGGDLYLPVGGVELIWAATVPQARGRGVATALLETGLAWASSQGHDACETDWRVTNLAASRFWPSRGFEPIAYRLGRVVH